MVNNEVNMEDKIQALETRAITWLEPHRNFIPKEVIIIFVVDIKELLAKADKKIMSLKINKNIVLHEDNLEEASRVSIVFESSGAKIELPCLVNGEENLLSLNLTEKFLGWNIMKAVCEKYDITYAVITPSTMSSWTD